MRHRSIAVENSDYCHILLILSLATGSHKVPKSVKRIKYEANLILPLLPHSFHCSNAFLGSSLSDIILDIMGNQPQRKGLQVWQKEMFVMQLVITSYEIVP